MYIETRNNWKENSRDWMYDDEKETLAQICHATKFSIENNITIFVTLVVKIDKYSDNNILRM